MSNIEELFTTVFGEEVGKNLANEWDIKSGGSFQPIASPPSPPDFISSPPSSPPHPTISSPPQKTPLEVILQRTINAIRNLNETDVPSETKDFVNKAREVQTTVILKYINPNLTKKDFPGSLLPSDLIALTSIHMGFRDGQPFNTFGAIYGQDIEIFFFQDKWDTLIEWIIDWIVVDNKKQKLWGLVALQELFGRDVQNPIPTTNAYFLQAFEYKKIMIFLKIVFQIDFKKTPLDTIIFPFYFKHIPNFEQILKGMNLPYSFIDDPPVPTDPTTITDDHITPLEQLQLDVITKTSGPLNLPIGADLENLVEINFRDMFQKIYQKRISIQRPLRIEDYLRSTIDFQILSNIKYDNNENLSINTIMFYKNEKSHVISTSMAVFMNFNPHLGNQNLRNLLVSPDIAKKLEMKNNSHKPLEKHIFKPLDKVHYQLFDDLLNKRQLDNNFEIVDVIHSSTIKNVQDQLMIAYEIQNIMSQWYVDEMLHLAKTDWTSVFAYTKLIFPPEFVNRHKQWYFEVPTNGQLDTFYPSDTDTSKLPTLYLGPRIQDDIKNITKMTNAFEDTLPKDFVVFDEYYWFNGLPVGDRRAMNVVEVEPEPITDRFIPYLGLTEKSLYKAGHWESIVRDRFDVSIPLPQPQFVAPFDSIIGLWVSQIDSSVIYTTHLERSLDRTILQIWVILKELNIDIDFVPASLAHFMTDVFNNLQNFSPQQKDKLSSSPLNKQEVLRILAKVYPSSSPPIPSPLAPTPSPPVTPLATTSNPLSSPSTPPATPSLPLPPPPPSPPPPSPAAPSVPSFPAPSQPSTSAITSFFGSGSDSGSSGRRRRRSVRRRPRRRSIRRRPIRRRRSPPKRRSRSSKRRSPMKATNFLRNKRH
jgi:hypothetical protein